MQLNIRLICCTEATAEPDHGRSDLSRTMQESTRLSFSIHEEADAKINFQIWNVNAGVRFGTLKNVQGAFGHPTCKAFMGLYLFY
jgi:hypothetical protein